jgi:hypothetical protein
MANGKWRMPNAKTGNAKMSDAGQRFGIRHLAFDI